MYNKALYCSCDTRKYYYCGVKQGNCHEGGKKRYAASCTEGLNPLEGFLDPCCIQSVIEDLTGIPAVFISEIVSGK